MSSERESAEDASNESTDAVLGTVFGYDVVLEREFVEFPWRAGLVRGPAALLVTFVLVVLVAAASGVSGGSVVGTLLYLALIVYGLHNIPAARGQVPEFLEPVAEQLLVIPALRGFVLAGPNHGDPLGHVIAIASGEGESIGHINVLPTDPTVPIAVYALIPMTVLVAMGYEFALRYWEDVTIDSVVEVGRFGAAIGAGYALTLFVGTFFITTVGLFGVLFPDRFMTLVFGFVYPAVFVTLGAFVVYLQREWLATAE